MFFYLTGFICGLPLGWNIYYITLIKGFFFREHKLQPPVSVNFGAIKRAFEIF
jgi:hypothetical protein